MKLPNIRMRVKIREQLSIMVALTALSAVGICALVTWVHNYRLVLDLRTSKLSLTTDLKSAQLSQALIILHNSVYSISTRLVLQNSLLRYNNQKNDTVENWVRALADLEVVTGTTGGGFGGLLQAVVWDKNLGHGGPGPLNVLGGRMGLMNVTGENAQGILIPASEHNGWRPGYMGNFTNIRNETSTPELLDSGRSLHDGFPNSLYPEPSFAPADYIYKRGGLVMGPLQINQTFYMLSYTVPIISNTGPSQLLGFLTVVVNAKLIVDIMKDTRGLGDTGQTVLVGPGTWGNFYTTEESDQIQSAEHGDIPPEITFTYLFPPALTPDLVGKKYNMSRYPAVGKAYHTGLKRYKNVTGTVDVAQIGVSDIRDERLQSAGRMEHTTNAQDVEVSVGYCMPSFGLVQWALIMEMHASEVYEPVRKLRTILLVTVFSTAFVVVLCACPVAHFAVRPITRLKHATERSTRPPSYSTDGTRSSASSDGGGGGGGDDDHDGRSPYSNVDPNSAETGRGFRSRSAFHNRFFSRFRTAEEVVENDNQRRKTFRIPERVRDHKHIIEDELTDLTRTYNLMTEELEKQYEHLEDRVHERTRELEEQKRLAETANMAKTLFVANISHELRTPLNGIMGMCSVCLTDDDLPRVRDSLATVYRSGELLLHLLTDLLTFSKNSVGHSIKLDEREFTISDISKQVMAIFAKQSKDAETEIGIEIHSNEDVANMVLWGDSNRILQVLINLFSNSLKFTPRKGSVMLRIECVEASPDSAPGSSGAPNDSIKSGLKSASGSRVGSRSGYSAFKLSGASRDVSKSFRRSPPAEATSGKEAVSQLELITLEKGLEKVMEKKSGEAGEEPVDGPSHEPGEGAANDSTERLIREICEKPTPVPPPEDATVYQFAFKVIDTGPGIPEHLHQKIFEPFMQGDLGLSKKHGGTGLGLSICSQLAKLMRGTIELERSMESVGSTFTMRIPLKLARLGARNFKPEDALSRSNSTSVGHGAFEPDGDNLSLRPRRGTMSPVSFNKENKPRLVGLSSPYFAHSIPCEPTPKSEKLTLNLDGTSTSQESRRILVAEDNTVNQEVVIRMLQLEDKLAEVIIACDGIQAIAKVEDAIKENRPFDLVLMDIQMPNLDGIESTKRIRKLGYRAPIVALTAFCENDNVRECLDAGMDYFLPKPIRRGGLSKVLKMYCPLPLRGNAGTATGSASGTAASTPAETPVKEDRLFFGRGSTNGTTNFTVPSTKESTIKATDNGCTEELKNDEEFSEKEPRRNGDPQAVISTDTSADPEKRALAKRDRPGPGLLSADSDKTIVVPKYVDPEKSAAAAEAAVAISREAQP